jgi:uncharacterized protein (DUF4415 family)
MKKPRGRPPLAITKMRATIRFDPDLLAHFRASGQGWQTRVNEVLRREMKKGKKCRRSSLSH